MSADMKNLLYAFMGFFVMALGAVLLYLIVTATWTAFTGLSETVQVAIFVGLFSLISTLGSISYTKLKERKLQIEAANTSKKHELYGKFTHEVVDMIANPDSWKEEDFQRMRTEFMENVVLWGNPDVLKAYHQFRVDVQTEDSSSHNLWDIATILMMMRKDMGLSNKNIDQYLITEIFINRDQLNEFYTTFPQKKK